MKNKQKGSVAAGLTAFVAIVILLWGLFWWVPCTRLQLNEDLVSGIVYNNTNDNWPNGNTMFAVRASVDTYTNESNESTFCLPAGSKYIPLVKEAAADKNIKVVVHTKKVPFTVVANPLVCIDNVEVTKAK